MAALDAVSIGILLGAVLVLAGILSSLVALRFGAPLLFVFLLIGLFAGEAGPGGIRFDDVRAAYTVGAVALALILFDGGLRTRFQTFRNVLGPAGLLATVGVLITAALIAPVAKFALGLGWLEALLVGSVIASTDAAAVFFLLHSRGLRLRPRVGATLEVESGTNDPIAIFLTILLVEIIMLGTASWTGVVAALVQKAALGLAVGTAGGWCIIFALNRFGLPQGLHAPLVAAGALAVFGATEMIGGSGYLAAYIAGLVVGNRPTRAHSIVIAFMDAATWLAQIAMFVLLGLLVWPERLPVTMPAAVLVALTLMFVARPVAVFICLAPYRFSFRERLFISWVGLRGAVAIFLASIPLLVGMPGAFVYFDVAFVVVLLSLLVQGWTLTSAAHFLSVSLPSIDKPSRRVELDLPGQLEQELVGYAVTENSLYRRRNVLPSWAKLTLVIRDEKVFSSAEAGEVRDGDYVYLLAPPDRAQALDRFFVEMPAPAVPDQRLLGDFFLSGDVTVGALGEIYGLAVAPEDGPVSLADFFARRLGRPAELGDTVEIGPVALIADRVLEGRVTTVGLDLAEPHGRRPTPRSFVQKLRGRWMALRRRFSR